MDNVNLYWLFSSLLTELKGDRADTYNVVKTDNDQI